MAVSRLNTNTASHVASGTLSRTVTINSGGTNVVAFAALAFDSNGSIGNYVINSVTLGGQAMTSCGTPILQTYGVACYYLVNPPTGSQTLAASITNATEIYSNVVVYQGVDQTTPVRSGTYSSGNANNRTVTSASGDLTMTVINGGSTGVSATNQTSDGIDAGGNFGMGSDHATTSASSVTHTWTGPSGTSCGILGFSIQQASAGSSFTGSAVVASQKGAVSASGTFTPAPVTGTASVASRKGTVSASGTHTPPAFTGTASVASRKATLSSSGTTTPPAFTGTAGVASRKATLSASGWIEVRGSVSVASSKATLSSSGTFTPAGFAGNVLAASKKATLAGSGSVTPPAFTGTVVISSKKAGLAALGAFTPAPITGTASVASKKATLAAFGTFTPAGFIPPSLRNFLLLGIGQ